MCVTVRSGEKDPSFTARREESCSIPRGRPCSRRMVPGTCWSSPKGLSTTISIFINVCIWASECWIFFRVFNPPSWTRISENVRQLYSRTIHQFLPPKTPALQVKMYVAIMQHLQNVTHFLENTFHSFRQGYDFNFLQFWCYYFVFQYLVNWNVYNYFVSLFRFQSFQEARALAMLSICLESNTYIPLNR